MTHYQLAVQTGLTPFHGAAAAPTFAASGGGQGAPGSTQQYEVSADGGATWTDETGGSPKSIISTFGMARTPGGFMYVGAGTTFAHGGTIFTSPDGVTLTLRVDGAVFPWTLANGSWGDSPGIFGAGFGNGVYIAGGTDENGNGHLETSPDTITWTPQTTGFANVLGGQINSLVYGAGTWVAVGFINGTKCLVQYSINNGVTWTTSSTNFNTLSPSIQLLGVTYGNGLFVAVGGTSDVTGNGFEIYTSPDGSTWTRQAGRPHLDNNDTLNGVTFGNGIFLAGGAYGGGGARGAILTSPDGVTWTDQTPSTNFNAFGARVNSVSFAGGVFLAGGFIDASPGPAVGGIMRSTNNGVAWTDSTINTSFGIVNAVA